MKKIYAHGSNVILKEFSFEEEKKTSLIINPKKEEVQFYRVVSSNDFDEDVIVMIKGFPITCTVDNEKYHIVDDKQIIAVIEEI